MEGLNEKLAKVMMESCKESKRKVQCEKELCSLKQKVTLLETEINDQKRLISNLEDQCKKYDESLNVFKERYEEQTKIYNELERQCQKYSAKIEDLNKELNIEKKLTEEWQVKCLRNCAQKNVSEQVDVWLIIILETN